jgi:DNA (cytosine-5)-methyltransferase 1
MALSSLELCTGAGGQAIGLETAGYEHEAVVEIDHDCCETLRLNRPNWTVLEEDIWKLKGKPFVGVDLFAAGLPCPPFSIAGQRLGLKDERNLFPAALRLIAEIRPRAVMISEAFKLAGIVLGRKLMCCGGCSAVENRC